MTDHIEEGATIYTDEALAHKGLPNHEAVKHSIGEFVREMASTNGLESFRAGLSSVFHGTFHHMSVEHLHRYVDEFTTRHNWRDQDTIDMMMNTFAGIIGKRLMYRDLVTDNRLSSGARLNV